MRPDDRAGAVRAAEDLGGGLVEVFGGRFELLVDPLDDRRVALLVAGQHHERHGHQPEHRQQRQDDQQQHAAAIGPPAE